MPVSPFRKLSVMVRARWRLALPILALALVASLGAGCASNGESLTTVTADLVAPPNVPPPITRTTPEHVVVNLTAEEKTVEIAPGVSYTAWTFNGTVPGPMIRVREGDTVEVRLTNPSTNTMDHSIDLHAVHGPGGGSGATTVLPGQTRAFTFKATTPGLFVYHCASGIVADHIANGMYGAILVEPGNGMPSAADVEYYVGQSEFYTTGPTNAKGLQALDYTKLLNETPTYVVFNGNTKALTGSGALQAKTGETVRLFVANGGPNLISSFHVIGEIMDRVWEYGSLENAPLKGVQTVLVPPGGAAIAEFKIDVPGDYKLVDHSISRVSMGAAGILHVTGPDNPSMFNPIEGVGTETPAASSTAAPSATTAAPSATTAAPSATTAAPSATTAAPTTPAAGVRTITMVTKDNYFETTSLTVSPGEKITFDVQNQGQVIHNLSIADAGGTFGAAASQFVPPGQTIQFDWTAPTQPGTYNFRCDVHPTQMTGKITVQ